MKPRTIAILTASHLCRNPRVVKEATTLGEAGFEVTVVSVSVHERFERMDVALMRGRPFRRVTLNYLATDPATQVSSFVQRTATWAARWLCKVARIETAQALGPAASLLRLARAHPADLTLLHTEIPLWAARALVRDGRRIAVDIEDWYSEDLLFADRRSRPLRLLRAAEEFALRHAAYASTTSASMAAALAATYRCPVPSVLRNAFPLQPRSRLDRPAAATPRLIWFSQTIGPGRGLELFFAAWAATRSPSQVCLLGDISPAYRERLLQRLPPGRRADVTFIPLVSPEELPDKLTEFDVGLALEPLWPRNKDLTISNKIFQYMNAGLALVATHTAGQTEVLRGAPGAGLLVQAHETTRLTAQLDALLGDPARLRTCQAAARAAARDAFSWEHDAPILLGAVERALATPPAA